jgi:uncharacterized protein
VAPAARAAPARGDGARARSRWAGAALLAILLAAPARAAAPVPPLSGPVVDRAGLLDARSARALESLALAARGAEGGQGVQLQYLVVPSLEGEPIEELSIRVAEAWRIGSKGKDNGVLFVVARDDRQVRIEVGGGLEGGLTDLATSRIIRGTIAPAFQAGRYGQGLYDASVQVLSALGALPQDVARRATRPAAPRFGLTSVVLGLFLLAFLSRIVGALGPRRSVLGRRRRGGMWFGGPFGGGWGGGLGGGLGGFGGGGGGWGGGGGGFSGGGASGRW